MQIFLLDSYIDLLFLWLSAAIQGVICGPFLPLLLLWFFFLEKEPNSAHMRKVGALGPRTMVEGIQIC